MSLVTYYVMSTTVWLNRLVAMLLATENLKTFSDVCKSTKERLHLFREVSSLMERQELAQYR